MNRLRLAILAKFLLTVPEEKFNLNSWKCGSTACAVGWACTIPEFRAEGLSYWNEKEYLFSPMYKGIVHFDAVEEFFNISFRDAEWLFGADQGPDYSEPTHVVERICDILKLDTWQFTSEDYNNALENEINEQREKAKAAKA